MTADEPTRHEVFAAPEGQGVAVIGAGGKVKLVAETVLLDSAYKLGWADATKRAVERVTAAEHLDDQARAEAIEAITREER